MSEKSKNAPEVGGAYAHYVLATLVVVYVFNFIDRHILSILTEDIKRDLGATDAQMGFLFGTVFAVFYAVFGIPLARFADVWIRRSIIAGGLVAWSGMTALSGLAQSFPMLAACRIGVGIGEAAASPAAYSLLSDYYPPARRATVIAIYSAGVFIGAGIGLFLGGSILDVWNARYPDPALAPFGLRGWQVAFMAVGLPGILVAVWVRTLREPIRGQSEGLVTEPHPAPFKLLGSELAAVIPPLNLFSLRSDSGALVTNVIAVAVITGVAALLIMLTGSWEQWIAVGIGVYISFSWAQSLKIRDPATFAMILRSKAIIYTFIAFPCIGFVMGGAGYWTPALLMRVHDAGAGEVGLYIGLGAAIGGLVGTTSGGIFSDWMKTKIPSGRLVISYICVVTIVPTLYWMIYSESLNTAYVMSFLFTLFASMWAGIVPSTASDLVMPRMRAVAGACFILVNTFIAFALGPYVIGQMSDVFRSQGMNEGQALQQAMALSMLILVVTLIGTALAQRYLPAEEANRVERARALGEPV